MRIRRRIRRIRIPPAGGSPAPLPFGALARRTTLDVANDPARLVAHVLERLDRVVRALDGALEQRVRPRRPRRAPGLVAEGTGADAGPRAAPPPQALAPERERPLRQELELRLEGREAGLERREGRVAERREGA